MVVLDYELNLSATEFLLFSECPQKFRLYRILNPLPRKDVFLSSSNRTISSYELRRYDEDVVNKIKYHKFFETFHETYAQVIHNTIPPKEIAEDDICLLYWHEQQKKYFEVEDLYYWYPVSKELKLMTENKRGKIDCLELCENKNGLRLIDYKQTPDLINQLSLLFYASLFNEYREENPNEEEFELDILEIGCYYYEMGIKRVQNLKENKSQVFDRLFADTLGKIANEEFFINKSSCWNCNFKYFCKIEQKKQRIKDPSEI